MSKLKPVAASGMVCDVNTGIAHPRTGTSRLGTIYVSDPVLRLLGDRPDRQRTRLGSQQARSSRSRRQLASAVVRLGRVPQLPAPALDRDGRDGGQPFELGLLEREQFNYDTEPSARAVVVVRQLLGDSDPN